MRERHGRNREAGDALLRLAKRIDVDIDCVAHLAPKKQSESEHRKLREAA